MRSKTLFAFLMFGLAVALLAQSAPAPFVQTTYALEPVAISNAVYPSAARDEKLQGEIVMSITVSETGDVQYARVFKGDPILAKAAEDSASGWKFKPVMKEGKAIAASSTATFNFVLGDDGQGPKEVVPRIAPATEFPRRVRVSSGVSQGLILKQVNPVYPPGARDARIQGIVLLKALIAKDGTVASLETISGAPELVPAATDAVRQWQYRPYLLAGRPVEVETQVQINFTLSLW